MNRINFSSKRYHDKISQPILWTPQARTFSVELSDLYQISKRFDLKDRSVEIVDTDTNKTISFKFTKADMDGSNEDTYGWNYSAVNCNLLIIND